MQDKIFENEGIIKQLNETLQKTYSVEVQEQQQKEIDELRVEVNKIICG